MARKKRKPGKKKSGQSSPEKAILAFLIHHPTKQYSRKQILKKFLNKYQKDDIMKALDKLLAANDIRINESNRIRLIGKAQKDVPKSLFEGIVDMTRSGAAYVLTDKLEHDIYVPQRLVNRALDKDKVQVAVYKSYRGRYEGEILKVLERAQEIYIGTLHRSENFAFLIPDKRNMNVDLFIPLDQSMDAGDGDKVMVRMKEWKKGKNPVGEVIEWLGHAGEHDIEMKSILLDTGFKLQFPQEVTQEAESLKDRIPEDEIAKRMDYREVETFTIDPEDAKDFDDALSFKQLENGNFEVGIHIADVTYYVRPETALDNEAYERATSVYLVDRVSPMLPEVLSNLICSLRPKEDKLTFSVITVFSPDLKLKEVAYGRTIINSDKRFTYEEAQEVIESKAGPHVEAILKMKEIAEKLRAERSKAGSINFETTEVKFKLDEQAKPIGIFLKERKDAHMLIEDFMLLANTLVAQYFTKKSMSQKQIPGVYRIHDTPDPQKLEVFATIARKFGYSVRFTDPQQTADTLNTLMKMIHGKNEENILSQLAIRSMAKAVYSTKNIGHFGLALKDYTHFTSPIRRYPDVLVHRVLQEGLLNESPSHTQSFLEEKCKHCSMRERSAQEAERASVKYKQVEYMSEHIGETFEAIISGVIPRGIFVEFTANKCEGFVSSTNLGDEEFIFEEAELSLIGIQTYKKFQFGNSVTVIVVKTSLEDKTIDCELSNDELK